VIGAFGDVMTPYEEIDAIRGPQKFPVDSFHLWEANRKI
jgi:hypothetical protein